MQNKYAVLAEWIKQYPPLSDWIYFNVTNVERGNVSLNSSAGARQLLEFLDGSRERELYFAVELVKEYDTGTSNINLDAMFEAEALAHWVESKSNADELPQFDGCTVTEIEMLNSAPSLAIDNEQQLAKYQMQGKVIYLEKGV